MGDPFPKQLASLSADELKRSLLSAKPTSDQAADAGGKNDPRRFQKAFMPCGFLLVIQGSLRSVRRNKCFQIYEVTMEIN